MKVPPIAVCPIAIAAADFAAAVNEIGALAADDVEAFDRAARRMLEAERKALGGPARSIAGLRFQVGHARANVSALAETLTDPGDAAAAGQILRILELVVAGLDAMEKTHANS